MRHAHITLIAATFIALATGPVLAAEAAGAKTDAAATTPPAPILNTVSLEVSPEFNAKTFGTTDANALNDAAFKLGYSRNLGNGWSWGISDQEVVRPSGPGAYQNLLETTLGYSIKLSDMISMPVSGGVGFVWDTRAASRALSDEEWAYYVVNAGVNIKFDSHWTWNAVSARFRNAFEGDWLTPKVQTGVTYTIDSRNTVYANGGYAWKTGAGGVSDPDDLGADKWSIAVGYRVGF